MFFSSRWGRVFCSFLFSLLFYLTLLNVVILKKKKKRVEKPALCPLAFHCLHTHSAASLSPITHTEDIQRVCQRGGHSARRPRQNRHLAQRWAGTKGPGQGSLGRLELPTPFSHASSFFLPPSLPSPSLFLESPAASIPPPLRSSSSILLPLLFCRSSGPIVWTASSTPSSSSGSPSKLSSMVSSSQRLRRDSLGGLCGWRGQSDTHTLS